MNKYELGLAETRSVLSEWTIPGDTDRLSKDIIDRLIAKGVIQSTDPEDLQDYRTGPLEPGRKVVGGSNAEEHFPGSTFRDLRDGSR
jgi:hypothetical protein